MIWKICKGHSGYEVSSTGLVRNIKTRRVLKQTPNRHGYIRIGIPNDSGSKSTLRVHRIVAEAFLDNPMKYPSVDHKNRVRTDNRVENLRWVDNSTNSNNRIYNVGVVEHIIELHEAGLSPSDIYKSLS